MEPTTVAERKAMNSKTCLILQIPTSSVLLHVLSGKKILVCNSQNFLSNLSHPTVLQSTLCIFKKINYFCIHWLFHLGVLPKRLKALLLYLGMALD